MGQGSRDGWRYTPDGIIGQDGDLVCDAPSPIDCFHLGCNVAKPVRTPRADAQHLVDIVETLVGRWNRAADKDDLFSAGRAEGYVQAIALLMGQPHAEVLRALREGL